MGNQSFYNSRKSWLSNKSVGAIGMIILGVSFSISNEIKWLSYLSYIIIISAILGRAYKDWKPGNKAEARSKVCSLVFVFVVMSAAFLIDTI